MSHSHRKPQRARYRRALLGALAAALVPFGLMAASATAATPLEQVAHFAGSTEAPKAPGVFPEEVQLGGVGGMAVNVNGTPGPEGVPPGTVYGASYLQEGGELWVAMYVPKAGGLEFMEAWRVTAIGGPYKRCGPLLGVNGEGKAEFPCEARSGSGSGGISAPAGYVDVEVDQATGDVYAFNGELTLTGAKLVVKYSPDGGKEITRFGELAPPSDTVAASPGKLHSSNYPGGLAVGGGGRVYVFDEHRLGESYHRLAVFEPDGEYVGEVAAGLPGEGKVPFEPVADAAGNVYVAGETYIQEYAPETPFAYHSHTSVPICSFESPLGGITAITVNRQSGEVFFYSEKGSKEIHRLGSCDTLTGKFGAEIEEIPWTPQLEPLWGLAFDPARQFSAGREAGVLYGGSPGPGKVKEQSSLGYIFAPAEENPPSVEGESATKVTASSAHLHVVVDPKSFETEYAFQYESEAEYEANEPDERQAVTVSATGGLFRLSLGGYSSGGAAKATLTAGSRTASALVVGKGSASTAAGSNVLTAVATSFGVFEVGQPIAGAGITAGARITAIEAGKIKISTPATATAAGVAISSAGAAPLEVGEEVEGAGIPANTKITAIEAGKATLSQPAGASGAGVVIEAGIAFDATAGQVRRVLEGMGSIGAHNVAVSGGPGDGAGSSPYAVSFTGALGNADLAQMSADASQLTGGGADAAVATLNDGGEGFSGAGLQEAPLGGAKLKSGVGPSAVGVTLTGLAPATAYRYRAVAQSECAPSKPPGEICEVAGPAQGIRTYAAEAGALPDERAWELVSPAQKQGGQVLPAAPQISSCEPLLCKPGFLYQHFPMQSSASGDAVAYEGTPFSEAGGAAVENEYVAKRDPEAGWQTLNPTPELLGSGAQQGYVGVSTGLDRAVIRQLSPTLSAGAPAGYANLYTQPLADPLALTPLVGAKPPNRPATGFGSFEVRYAGASTDGSRIFFEANDALTKAVSGVAPQAEDGGAGKFNLYEWHEGQLALVNVKPANATTKAGAHFGAGSAQAISKAGDRAFWSDEAGQVYVRIDAKETREIPDHSGKFLSAAADGAKVLLSDGRIYGHLEEEPPVLEADLAQGKGGFQGLLGQAADLSHVYFVDTAVLSGEEENEAGEVAGEGEDNLYAWDGLTTRFVAVLLPEDNTWAGSGGGIADWAPSPSNRTAQASPDGRFVAFLSRAPLSGYDNTGPCEEISGTGVFIQTPCPEAFIYDSASGRLACASCDPSGAAPLGWAALRRIFAAPPYLPQPRYLSNSGRLFFDSADSLSPADTNEGVEDVYEWEPQGVGSCTRAGGCVALISAGREGADSNFLAADPSGANVFFTSRDRLVGRDSDGLIDLYDARVEGGFPFESLLPPGQCQGEGCQPLPPASPEAGPPSSSTSFPGNSSPPKPCKKGQVKKKGKCVKKPAAKKHPKAKRKGGVR